MKRQRIVSHKPKQQELTKLAEEALAWDSELSQESLATFEAKLTQAEPLETVRPSQHPVSVQLEQQDFILLKRCAQRRGIPYNRLVALWIHERLCQEQKAS
jgi:predicted DNA binding CopG/RHH family protein